MLATITVLDPIDTGDVTRVGSLSWAIEGFNIIQNQGLTAFRNNSLYNNQHGRFDTNNNGIADDFVPGLSSTAGTNFLRFSVNAFPQFTGVSNANAVILQPGGQLPEFETGVTIEGFDNSVGSNIIIDGTNRNNSFGLRFDPASSAAGIIINDVIVQNVDFDGLEVSRLNSGVQLTVSGSTFASNGLRGIDLRDLPSGGGTVSFTGNTIGNNQGGISISDSSVPSNPGAVTISGNTINDNGFAVSLGAGTENVSITNNPTITAASGAAIDINGAENIRVANNSSITAVNGPAVDIRGNASDINVENNTLLSVNESPVTVAASAGSQIRISDNTFIHQPALEGTSVIPPIDLLDDNLIEQPDLPNDSDTGPNGLLNAPRILEDRVTLSNGSFSIPFETSFDQQGTYRFELYRRTFAQNDTTSQITWTPIASTTRSVNAGLQEEVISVSDNVLSAGDLISIVAIGESGPNEDNTSEFAFDSDSTQFFTIDVSAPQISNILFRSSTWTPGISVSLANRLAAGAQTLPLSQTSVTGDEGVDQIDLIFTEAVNITTDDVRIRTSNGFTPFLTPSQIIENPDGNAATQDYRFVFSSALPSDKYVLEIDDSVTDLAGRAFDGEWNVDYGEQDNYFDDLFFGAGDGNDGGDLEARFAILYGDANGDGEVTADDQAIGFDINADGLVNATDQSIVGSIVASGSTRLLLGADLNSLDLFDDDRLDSNDFQLWTATFGGGPGVGDFNRDGVVNSADFVIIRDLLGLTTAWTDTPVALPALQIGQAPQVTNVTISGSASNHTPFSFSSAVGGGQQLGTVPVGGADTISITFSEDVFVSSSYLNLIGLTSGIRPTLADFAYDSQTLTASWRFEGWNFGDTFALWLSDSVTDIDGNPLDGEWTNPESIATSNGLSSTFPSGDGVYGGDFTFLVSLLPGDADLDGVVSFSDFITLAQNFGQAFDATFSSADFNGDGAVTFLDFSLLSSEYGTNQQGPAVLLADLDNDLDVDDDDRNILFANFQADLTDPTQADGDLNEDGVIDDLDFDILFEQIGLDISTIA